MVVIGEALIFLGSGADLRDIIFGDHAVAEGLQKLKKVFEVDDFSLGDGLAGDVVEIVVDDFGDEIDDSLNFLAGR